MINFNEIKYERIDFENTKKDISVLLSQLNQTNNFEEYISVVKNIIDLQNYIEEMYDYADIRNMRDNKDEYYQAEIDYWNTYKSQFDALFLPFYDELGNSKYKDQLMNYIPSNFFRIIEYKARISSNEITDLVKKEKDLMAQCRRLNQTKVIFNDEEKTISATMGFFTNKDRELRKQAHDTVNDFYYQNHTEYDHILYELVTVRNEIAKKLGFDNYVEYSLYNLKRFDYSYKEISQFRNNIIKYFLPICDLLQEWQKEELGFGKVEYYDTVYFTEMPELKYHGIDLLNELKKSFSFDSELSQLYNQMLENGYIDLIQSDKKVSFSITNYLAKSCVPVITGNYKDNYFDVQTTTHEMGHSFQKYCASVEDKKYLVSSLLKYPILAVAEIFSYSMELIMLNHIDNLFNEKDYNKYCFMKIYNLITNLPEICLVDEFQQQIYSKTDLKETDFREMWMDLANKYHLSNVNSGHINLATGGYFYRKSHIYLDPFYFIDYALSYFGALSVWNKCNNDIDLFKEIGGVASYYSFKKLIEKYNMPDPFNDKVVEEVSVELKKILDNYKNN